MKRIGIAGYIENPQRELNHRRSASVDAIIFLGDPIKYSWYVKLYRWVFLLPQQYEGRWTTKKIAMMNQRNAAPLVINIIRGETGDKNESMEQARFNEIPLRRHCILKSWRYL